MKTENISINDLVNKRINEFYFLPSIQREFVWDFTDKVPSLFDSIIKNFPIGHFLICKTETSKIKWDSYKFLDKYVVKNLNKGTINNEEKYLNLQKEKTFVIDGQQRMTALYFGLKYFCTQTNDKNNSPKNLYLHFNPEFKKDTEARDYIQLLEGDNIKYNPKKNKSSREFWIPFNILIKEKPSEIIRKMRFKNKSFSNNIKSNIRRLSKLFNEDKIINLEFIKNQDAENILEIFFRLNTKGQPLTNGDLLLAVMENTIKNHNLKIKEDPRELISGIEEEPIFKKYDFDRKHIMKAVLFFGNFRDNKKRDKISSQDQDEEYDMTLKFSKFKDNEEFVKRYIRWIKRTGIGLRSTLKLLEKYYLDKGSINSYNSIIPLAYYVYINKNKIKIVKNNKNNNLIKWFIKANLKGEFGGNSDQTLKEYKKSLKVKETLEKLMGRRSLNEEDVRKMIKKCKYKHENTYLLLYLTTSEDCWIDIINVDKPNKDHIFPSSKFNETELIKNKVKKKDIDECIKNKDNVLNLQFITSNINKEKSDNFIDIYNSKFFNKKDRQKYIKDHSFPKFKKLDWKNFLDFIDAREDVFFKKICNSLDIKIMK